MARIVDPITPAADAALRTLGHDLALARTRRRESLRSWAGRLGVSVPTLMRLEAGEPGVSVGVLANALWLLGRDGALATLAAPADDLGALEQDVARAERLGRARAAAAASALASRRRAQKA